MRILDENSYPHLARLVAEVLASWPEHDRYLGKSLGGRDQELMRHSEMLAGMVRRLSSTIPGGMATLASDYRFLCQDIVLPEELHFRRTGSYRLTKFQDALREVYNDHAFMTRYMNGLLVSDVLWINHCQGLQHYVNFIARLRPQADVLEIGPGHGLLLYLASERQDLGKLSAWDISQASLDMSRHALQILGAQCPVTFEMRNIFDPSIMDAKNAALFDAVILSEVLEHLEHPDQAVRVLYHLCKPGGRVWINVPANSPAPDHLYLVSAPRQAEALVRSVGFDVIDSASFAMTGATMERAIKQKLTITCIVVGERPR
jgi:2-polyprenyl-3-methyl-5-hydroxy-6-metoxy-1,4-benzoquinol methylase